MQLADPSGAHAVRPYGTHLAWAFAMTVNTGALSSRRRIRLSASAYIGQTVLVTICTVERRHLFGIVMASGAGDANVELSVLGEILRQEWTRRSGAHETVASDAFVIMPNHVHGIVRVGTAPLATFIRGVKSAVTSRAHREIDEPVHRVWQRGYHDRILRDDVELVAAKMYIANNPIRWAATP
jgi:putative transposase